MTNEVLLHNHYIYILLYSLGGGVQGRKVWNSYMVVVYILSGGV